MTFNIPWGTIKSLAIFFGPIVIPRILGFYRSVRKASKAAGLTIQPLTPSLSRSFQLLLGVSLVFLVASFPNFGPENIFIATSTRLQAPTDVLFTRLAATRPDQALTAADEILRSKFVNMESRCLYAAYGPDVLTGCLFCGGGDDGGKSYLVYSLPDILAPHLLNLVVIGVATSTLLTPRAELTAPPKFAGDNAATRTKKAARQWRAAATMVTAVLILFDLYLAYSVDHLANKTSKRLGEVEWHFWRFRSMRFFLLFMVDSTVAALVFLSGTNRAFAVGGMGAAERVDSITRALAGAKAKMSAAAIVKNTANRSEELRKRSDIYWSQEVAIMGEVMQEREVLDGVNDALEGRLNLGSIQRDAEQYTDSVFRPLLVKQAMELGRVGTPTLMAGMGNGDGNGNGVVEDKKMD